MPDDDQGLGKVAADPCPNRRRFTFSLAEAVTARGGHKPEMTVETCRGRQRYRPALLVQDGRHLLAVRTACRARVGVDSAHEIDFDRLIRARDSIWFALFSDHDKSPLGVDALDRVERKKAPTPEEDAVSADREALPARVRIVDQLDHQPDPSVAKVEHRVTCRLREEVGLAAALRFRLHAAIGSISAFPTAVVSDTLVASESSLVIAHVQVPAPRAGN
jgi:hypothetical protein